MVRSYENRRKRGEAIKVKSTKPDPHTYKRCATIGCLNPPQRRAGKGLSHARCSRCVRHHQRHGSAWCPSISGTDIKLYKWTSAKWLALHAAETTVTAALTAIGRLMRTAGRAAVYTRGER